MSSPDKSETCNLPPFCRSVSKDWTIVFVLGGPGCGKGTQCQRIVQDFGFLHLSAGDLLRAEVKKGTDVGQNCEKLMKEGKLVPLEVTLTLLQNAMNSSGKNRFLIDGFPRAVDQAKAFENKVGMPDKVLFLECPQKVMEERLMKRGETSGRVDDTPATILKRFETFERESMPVAAHYEALDPNIILKVSSVPPPDLVYNVIHHSLKNLPRLNIIT
ncbi:unnamed protein product [Calypogeia fissa]